ncbi:MAG: DNA-binding response regulator [Burkholderiales bacterium PBB6]|uniref:Response regulator transcription factor n=1 Tax=Ideonella margarita TaxID=2984191 RepID=A0ABU9BZR5_9BURK|nr:MAG: DNA-binding response regulator [Burkholderiales bacterium PBB6]
MKVLLVDDHPLILSALKAMMESIRPGVAVTALGTAKEARDALQRDASFDLVLLDLQLGEANGFDLLAELRSAWPALPVVVVSASDRSSDVIRSIDLGAMGFLPKRMSTQELAEALRLVMAGGIFVPTMTAGDDPQVEEDARVASPAPLPYEDPYQTMPSFEELGLTPRQHDVLTLLLQGKPNKDIARRMGLSVETVKDHVQAVLRGLNVNSRTQAVLAVGQLTQQRRRAAATAAGAAMTPRPPTY